MVVEARRSTVEHGLSGFTIEQLCESVGVSRRTFFNHFGSKEDVVLGIELNADIETLQAYAGGRSSQDLDPLCSIVALAIEQVRSWTSTGRKRCWCARSSIANRPWSHGSCRRRTCSS